MTHTALVVWAGFAIGIIFGAVGQRIEFCLSGGLREWWQDGAPRRAAAVLFAMAVAVAGTQVLAGFGFVELRESIYLQAGFSWLLIPLGGLLFGYGMILARGCGARALVLLAEGNLRSLVVLLCLGIAAYMTLTGVLAPLRISIAEATTVTPALTSSSLPGLLESWGAGPGTGWILSSALVSGALAVFALFRLKLSRVPWQAGGALVIGSTVPLGWLTTGYFGADDFDPVRVESLSFIAPVGDSIQYLMLSTGTPLGFGVTVVAGVVFGALAASLTSRSFELRSFEKPEDMLAAVGGGVLMGTGGALALGCSIGQGLSGLSTLALPSFVAVASIFLGALAALRGPFRVARQPKTTTLESS